MVTDRCWRMIKSLGQIQSFKSRYLNGTRDKLTKFGSKKLQFIKNVINHGQNIHCKQPIMWSMKWHFSISLTVVTPKCWRGRHSNAPLIFNSSHLQGALQYCGFLYTQVPPDTLSVILVFSTLTNSFLGAFISRVPMINIAINIAQNSMEFQQQKEEL